MRPRGYDPNRYPPFAVTVDLVVLTIRDQRLVVLLVRRGDPPYAGRWALPGGFVHPDESLDRAAARELLEETRVDLDVVHREQIRTYGEPRRDPRMRVVSVAYLAIAPDLPNPVAGSDAAQAAWKAVDTVLGSRTRLAFDHDQILRDGVERARAKLEYSSLATRFCPPEFTITQLRQVYEAVWGAPLDPRNFNRKVKQTTGFLHPVGRQARSGPGRPADIYTPGTRGLLHPPILREP
jgi:8-oxo-dGTP diphosphatase